MIDQCYDRSRLFHSLLLMVLSRQSSPSENDAKPEFILNGRRTTTLENFYLEIGQVLLSGSDWEQSLDGLYAVLRGDYGHLPETFRLVWQDADYARAALGYEETVRQRLRQLRDCPPTSLIKTAWALRAALRGKGLTVFDWLVEVIRQQPNVEFVLVEASDAEASDAD